MHYLNRSIVYPLTRHMSATTVPVVLMVGPAMPHNARLVIQRTLNPTRLLSQVVSYDDDVGDQ